MKDLQQHIHRKNLMHILKQVQGTHGCEDTSMTIPATLDTPGTGHDYAPQKK